MPILGKIVAHFWGEFRGLAHRWLGIHLVVDDLVALPFILFARPDGTGQNMEIMLNIIVAAIIGFARLS